MPVSAVVRCRGLTRSFPNGSGERVVLDGVDCDLPEGRLVALMGPSGSGKSTLLNILGGLQDASMGEVTIDGQDITGLGPKELTGYRARTVGFVFQEWNLLADLTVLENVALPLRLTGATAHEVRARALKALSRVGLEGHGTKFPQALSGGEQQRAAIARAVIDDRPLLLADEPTGALDRENAAMVMSLLRGIVREGQRSVLVATHDRDVASACDEVWRITDGQLVVSDVA